MIRPKLIVWILKIVMALILLQTLYFKFTAHPDSVYIFSKIGMEPGGRIGIGVLELITSVLILIPATTWLGAGLGLCLMSGATYFHLTVLGVSVNNDGGSLFTLAIIVFIISAILLWINRRKIPIIGKQLFS